MDGWTSSRPRLMGAVSQQGRSVRIRNGKALWPINTIASLGVVPSETWGKDRTRHPPPRFPVVEAGTGVQSTDTVSKRFLAEY